MNQAVNQAVPAGWLRCHRRPGFSRTPLSLLLVPSHAKCTPALTRTAALRGRCCACCCGQVVVAEDAPRYDGHAMARQLADAKVHTTLIADSAVFAMMARANKVCLPASPTQGRRPLRLCGRPTAQARMHACARAAQARRWHA